MKDGSRGAHWPAASPEATTTKAARTVAVRQGETINASALTVMFKQIIANNRAGGRRKLKGEDLVAPPG